MIWHFEILPWILQRMLCDTNQHEKASCQAPTCSRSVELHGAQQLKKKPKKQPRGYLHHVEYYFIGFHGSKKINLNTRNQNTVLKAMINARGFLFLSKCFSFHEIFNMIFLGTALAWLIPAQSFCSSSFCSFQSGDWSVLVFAGTQLWPDPWTFWVWALLEQCIVQICHYGGKFVENRWNTLSSPCRTDADRLRGATSRSSITNTPLQGNNQSLLKKAKQTKRPKMMHRPQSRRSLQT